MKLENDTFPFWLQLECHMATHAVCERVFFRVCVAANDAPLWPRGVA
jgi:hypothetical protein